MQKQPTDMPESNVPPIPSNTAVPVVQVQEINLDDMIPASREGDVESINNQEPLSY